MENEDNVEYPPIDADEFSVVEKETEKARQEAAENGSNYTHRFSKPFIYGRESYDELSFDWDSLTGQVDLDIEQELQMHGVTVIAAEFNGKYLATLAAKACTVKIGSDAFGHMPFRDWRRIRRAARSFLLMLE